MKESAEQSSLASEAYSVVRQRILRGDISLGQVISRRKLAAELSMSFLPVSEALLRLEIEGLLESRPRAGTRVRIPSPEDVQGHYVVREALEVQAAIRFTQVATPGERSELKKLAARVDQLSQQMDRPLYQTVHQKLHARIAQCARCPALLDAIEKTHALASIWFCVMRTAQAGGFADPAPGAGRSGVQRRPHPRGRRSPASPGGGRGPLDGSATAVLQAAQGDRPHVPSQRQTAPAGTARPVAASLSRRSQAEKSPPRPPFVQLTPNATTSENTRPPVCT